MRRSVITARPAKVEEYDDDMRNAFNSIYRRDHE
jgi:hypothetical protein